TPQRGRLNRIRGRETAPLGRQCRICSRTRGWRPWLFQTAPSGRRKCCQRRNPVGTPRHSEGRSLVTNDPHHNQSRNRLSGWLMDAMITVKSREIQRALLAEMAKDREAAVRHFLAAAHLELVLASDYQAAGDRDMAWRSAISAASCFWRAGQQDKARQVFAALSQSNPAETDTIQSLQDELARDYPALAS